MQLPRIREFGPGHIKVKLIAALVFIAFAEYMSHEVAKSTGLPAHGVFDAVLDSLLLACVAAPLLYILIKSGQKNAKLNRLLYMMTAIDQKVINARSREQLFNDACNIAVEHGNFLMAWVGLEDKAARTVIPAAQCGRVEGYLDAINIVTDDTREGMGPSGTALRTGEHSICNDIENDPMMSPWRDAALMRGYRSSAAFPLFSGQRVVGVYNVYSAAPGSFNDKEVILLDGLAANISHAIEFMEQEERRRQAEDALRKSEELYRTLARNFPNGAVFLFDKDLRYLVADGTGLAEVGLTREGLEGRTICDALPPETCAQIEPIYRATLDGNIVVTELPYAGHTYLVRSAPVKDHTGQVYAGLLMTQDITKFRQADAAIRESEERYRSLFQSMLEGYAYCRLVYEDGRAVDFVYLSVNDAFEKLTGLKDVVGRKITEIIPGIRESNPELLEIYGRVVLTGKPEEFETYSGSFGGWLAVSVYRSGKDCFVAVFDNITERRLAEVALIKKNQELYALNRVADTIASSPDIEGMLYNVLDTTLALPFLEVQKKAALFLRDEADTDRLNMSAQIGIAPELVEMEKQIRMGHCLCGKAAETGEVVTSEDCFTDPGHHTQYAAMKNHGHVVVPIKSKERVLGVMTFYLEPGTPAAEPDVRLLMSIANQLAGAIENRHLLQHIEKANKEWRETFDAMEELVTIHSADFTILRANKAAAEAAGLAVNEMAGRKCYELFHHTDSPIPICPAKALLEGHDAGFSYDVPMGEATYEISVYPLKDDGRLTAFVHIAKDITERKAAESALIESESKFRTLVEQSIVGVYIIQDDAFKYVNPRFAEIFGYAPGELVHLKSPRDLTFPDDWPIVEESLRKRESGEAASLHYTFRGVTKQGGIIHVEIHGSRTLYEGKMAGIGVLTDITERLMAQEELVKKTQQMAILRQASVHLEEISRLKSEFLANMSHELRTPLNAIIGLSQVLHDGTYGQLTQKQSEYLDGINQSGRHLLSLINDILDLSKIEAGKEKLELAEFSIANLVRNSFMLVKEKALKHGIVLVLDIDHDIGNFYADERRVKQIIFNLLANSLKFTEPGGKVGLRVHQDSQALVITVWDTGIGIPKDKQHLLFQPFQMIDNTLSKKHEGTGLGLVLVKRLAGMHGGTVTFESIEGKGTSFTVTLPARPPETAIMPEAVADAAPTAVEGAEEVSTDGMKVMVVEDNHLNMLLASDYLKANGFAVIEAASGEIAIEKVLRERPDIILLDIQMPGIDGFEVIGRLKGDPATSGIPAIAMTALAMKGDEQRCIEAGFDGYISKPVDLADMLRKVRLYLRKGHRDGK